MIFKISYREYEIIKLLAKGLIDKEIAKELKISQRTVQTYVVRIILKTRAKNRSHAVANYVRALMHDDPMGLNDFFKW